MDKIEEVREKQEFDRFSALCGRAAEHFPDFLLVVRRVDGKGYMSKTSNGDWAYGILKRKCLEMDIRFSRYENQGLDQEEHDAN